MRLRLGSLRVVADAAPPRRAGPLARAGWAAFLAARGSVGAALVGAAALHRRSLARTAFVGVTGSAGKTTAKDLIAAVLASRFAGVASRGNSNNLLAVVRTLARTRARHRFCVQELGTWGPGSLARSIRLLGPDVGVVTVVGKEHWSAFRSLEAVAREKASLVEALGPSGTAVLNADDPLIRAMASHCAGRVVTVGLAADADLRAVEVRAAWPDRLSFDVLEGDRAVPVQTRLVGAHWVPSVLAALAVGRVLGVSFEDGSAAVARVEPQPGRMSVVERPDGVVFLRDDYKAPLWSVRQSLDVLAHARARRRIAVIGALSDKRGGEDQRYRQVGRWALAAADHVVFVGSRARLGRHAANGEDGGRLSTFPDVDGARRFLRGFLRTGDLVLLKGTRRVDDLPGLLPPEEARRRGHDPLAGGRRGRRAGAER